MTTAEYVSILKFAIKTQIEYIREESDYEYSELKQGKELGLMIALQKIEDSMFLVDDQEGAE